MIGSRRLGCIVLAAALASTRLPAQQPDPFGVRRPDSAAAAGQTPRDGQAPARPRPTVHFDADSVIYHLAPASRLEVKTGKAGLFGFAGHSHVIRAGAFSGRVAYYPKAPASSHLEITILTDSLEVLTPPDTAEIRKVTEAMRTEVLQVDRFHEITLATRSVTPTPDGFHLVGELTLVGETREVPMDVSVALGIDSLHATSTFSVKQSTFGIKPFSGGPAGTVKVADRVVFTIEAVAARADAEGAAPGR